MPGRCKNGSKDMAREPVFFRLSRSSLESFREQLRLCTLVCMVVLHFSGRADKDAKERYTSSGPSTHPHRSPVQASMGSS